MTEYVKVKSNPRPIHGANGATLIDSSYAGEVGEVLARKLSLDAGSLIVRLKDGDIVLSKSDVVTITRKEFFAERLRGN